MVADIPPPEEYVARLREIVRRLPEAREEDAWRGVRWRVGSATFAHTLVVVDGAPASYARAAGVDGPATVLTFHATGDELVFFTQAGLPYFSPRWSATVVGMLLDDDTDWSEVAEALAESYRAKAPARLVRLLDAGEVAGGGATA